MLLVLLVAWGSSDQSMLINATMDIKPAAHIPIFRMRTCSWIIWAKLKNLSCLKQGGYGGHMVHLQIGARASYHSKVILHLHTGSRYGPTFCSPASNNVRPTWHHFSLLCPYCTLSYITVRPLHFCYCFIKCMWGYSSSCVCNCDMSTSQFENIWSHGYTRISYPAKEKVAQ